MDVFYTLQDRGQIQLLCSFKYQLHHIKAGSLATKCQPKEMSLYKAQQGTDDHVVLRSRETSQKGQVKTRFQEAFTDWK
jgi:hypothetical protein